MFGLDFETYSPVDINKHGLDRYFEHPHFKVLRGAVARKTEELASCDFVLDPTGAYRKLSEILDVTHVVTAQNVGFEIRVLKHLGLWSPNITFRDSAVVGRALGAASKLELAAPQLLPSMGKMPSGRSLINLFSKPGKYQEKNGSTQFDPRVVQDNPMDWHEFGRYCFIDADLSDRITRLSKIPSDDLWVTNRMNLRGWPVDMDLVRNMQDQYFKNLTLLEQEFINETGAADLNINSHSQLTKWVADRGVRMRSFDTLNVTKTLPKISTKLASLPDTDPKYQGYHEVYLLLRLKKELGGSSLKKLQTIIDTVGADGRLREQYVHLGAATTHRTSGRGVQMQNLKRLPDPDNPRDMDDDLSYWNNDELAENIRQVFTSSHSQGQLIVADFKSVEARALAWAANATWKTDAFRKGLDMYKVQAAKIYSIDYDNVGKPERQTGKVGELSCGYQAGAEAVKDFAEKMGIVLTLAEAESIVRNWRDINPEIVALWARLDAALQTVLNDGYARVNLPNDSLLEFSLEDALPTIVREYPSRGNSLRVVFYTRGQLRFQRLFPGFVSQQGRLRYLRGSSTQSGPLWKEGYIHPKTKQFKHYELYGGKLTGIFIQSLCREIFFHKLRLLESTPGTKPAELIGQFHDEAVLDWTPNTGVDLDRTKEWVKVRMSGAPWGLNFPLEVDVKSNYRYNK